MEECAECYAVNCRATTFTRKKGLSRKSRTVSLRNLR